MHLLNLRSFEFMEAIGKVWVHCTLHTLRAARGLNEQADELYNSRALSQPRLKGQQTYRNP
jgi:hypothetical protein